MVTEMGVEMNPLSLRLCNERQDTGLVQTHAELCALASLAACDDALTSSSTLGQETQGLS